MCPSHAGTSGNGSNSRTAAASPCGSAPRGRCSRLPSGTGRRSHRSPVKVLHRDRVQIDAFEATNVDGGHRVALRVGGQREWMDAASLAEPMLDAMLVEEVSAHVLVCRLAPRERSA